MASQTPKAPIKSDPREPKRGIKNPGIYAGTIVVLVIVVIAFIFVPMGGGSTSSLSNNGQSLDFGRYAGKPISYATGSYMALQVRALNDQMRQAGYSEDNYQLFAYQVYRGAFERTVLRLAAIDAVVRAGGFVTEAWIDQQVLKDANFQENGTFSAQKWQAASLGDRLQVRNQIRDDALYNAYFTDVLGVSQSSKEVAFVKDMAKDTRTIQYAAIALSKYPDSEVLSWGKAHADLFRSLTLSSVTIASSEAEAKKLLKNIQDKKTTFEDVAKASSKDANASKGGLGTPKYYFDVESELAAKADAAQLASLKIGEISPVLKTSSGSWAFYKVSADIIPADFGQGVVLAAVRDYVTKNERGVVEDWALAEAKALSSAGNGFEAAAKKAGATVKTAGPFPLNYGDLSVYIQQYGQNVPLFKSVASDSDPDLSGAATSEKFLTQAFSLAPGTVSDPFVLGENVLVVKVKEASSAKDDETGSIDVFYPYFFKMSADAEARDLFMKSPQLKDNFASVFFKYFQPSTSAAKKG